MKGTDGVADVLKDRSALHLCIDWFNCVFMFGTLPQDDSTVIAAIGR